MAASPPVGLHEFAVGVERSTRCRCWILVTSSSTGVACRLMSLQLPASNRASAIIVATVALFVLRVIPPLQLSRLRSWRTFMLRSPQNARRDEDQQLIMRVADVVRLEQIAEHRNLM